MKREMLKPFFCAIFVLAGPLSAQVTLYPSPARVLGHARLTLSTANPNLVEGRELFSPQGVALDTSASPPILYVADTLNNRVLAWQNASQFFSGALADIVIGQKDKYTTFPQGPFSGAQLVGGLYSPTGVAVDSNGNLFVADSGNNRILRYPPPFSTPDEVKLPDLVIGQTNLGSNTANAGGISDRTVALRTGAGTFRASLLFDPQGNLYFTDSANQRVLRYPASAIGPGATNGPAANLVVGQVNYTTSPPQNPASITDLSRLSIPSGLALDPSGRLYVSDALHRVLVYAPPALVAPGRSAERLIGGLVTPQGQPLDPPTERSLRTPEGVFLVGNIPFVIDTGNNRILRFDPYENWPGDVNTPPSAKGVIGQDNVFNNKPNKGSSQASPDSLSQPTAAVFAAGELFVVDSLNHRLLVLPDPTSQGPLPAQRVLGQPFLDTQSANLIEGREFSFSSVLLSGGGMAVDTHSDPPHLYVADTANNRVLAFRDVRQVRPGTQADLVIGQPDFYRSIANYPTGDPNQPSANSLFHPVGLAVDAAGNVYVADTGNARVLRFSAPFQAGVNRPDAELVLGKPNFVTPLQAGPDPTRTNMGNPYGLAFTQDGHLLVSDLAFNRVLLFRKPEGGDFSNGMAAEKVFGQADFFSRNTGSASNRMNGPRHISADTDDRLYVCDTGNNRVQIFDRVVVAGPDPSAAVTLTSASPVGSVRSPYGVFVSWPTGEIWVMNTSSLPGQAPHYDGNVKYLLRYPRFFDLPKTNFAPDTILRSESSSELPLAATLDSFGNLLVAYSTHRIATYFPAMTPVNAANYLARMAPGMIVALYPLDQGYRTFGEETKAFNELPVPLPMPTELADIQVLVNDQPAPLFFVSPEQINFQMPMNVPSSGSVELQVVRRSVGQVLAIGCSAVRTGTKPDGTSRYACTDRVLMDVASPALFAGDAGVRYDKGTGAAAALNVKSSDGSYYGINSPMNPVSRGDILELYGTGQGFIQGAPPDGTPPTGAVPTELPKPRVWIGTDYVPDEDVQYSGLAPYLVGVWQINVKIPERVAPSSAVVLFVVYKSRFSNTLEPGTPAQVQTTIAVKQ